MLCVAILIKCFLFQFFHSYFLLLLILLCLYFAFPPVSMGSSEADNDFRKCRNAKSRKCIGVVHKRDPHRACTMCRGVICSDRVSCKECKKWDNKTFASFLEYMRSFQSSTDIPVMNSPRVPAIQDGVPAHVAAAETVDPPLPPIGDLQRGDSRSGNSDVCLPLPLRARDCECTVIFFGISYRSSR